MQTLQRGFTLLEMMIVTAVVGILASLAVPSYQAYVYRAKAAQVIVVMDKVHNVLAELQSQTGASVGKPIRIMPADADLSNGAAPAFVYCIRPPGNSICGERKPLSGLTRAELAFPELGVELHIGAGMDPFSLGAGQYKLALVESDKLTHANPALRVSAQQTILAVHDIMKRHAYRDVIRIDKSYSDTYLYMSMTGVRP